MRRLIGVLILLGALSLAVAVPSAAAQSYYGGGGGYGSSGSAGDWGSWWYGPFAFPGHLNGPYGSIGATGFGSTGYGCGQGAYGFSNYGHGTAFGLGPGQPTCGGFGNWPYLYPYYTGYPYSNGAGPLAGFALAGLSNNNPFLAGQCTGLAIGSNFLGQSNALYPGAAGQYNIGANVNVLNLANPAFATLQNYGTFAQNTNLQGCVAYR
jgi:hypothetical protein